MLTDYVLGVVSLLLAQRLLRLAGKGPRIPLLFWAAAFLSTAFGAFTGGTVHGLGQNFAPAVNTILWKATVFSIGFSGFFMLSAALIGSLPARVVSAGLALAAVKLVTYLWWMAGHDDFRYVIYDYGSAMVLVLVIQTARFFKEEQRKSAAWISAGILVSFLAAGIQASGFALHPHFNHNDLFHAVQMGGLYLLYRGARGI